MGDFIPGNAQTQAPTFVFNLRRTPGGRGDVSDYALRLRPRASGAAWRDLKGWVVFPGAKVNVGERTCAAANEPQIFPEC